MPQFPLLLMYISSSLMCTIIHEALVLAYSVLSTQMMPFSGLPNGTNLSIANFYYFYTHTHACTHAHTHTFVNAMKFIPDCRPSRMWTVGITLYMSTFSILTTFTRRMPNSFIVHITSGCDSFFLILSTQEFGTVKRSTVLLPGLASWNWMLPSGISSFATRNFFHRLRQS